MTARPPGRAGIARLSADLAAESAAREQALADARDPDQCRWEYECAARAVTYITVTTLRNMRVAACDEHAEWHRQWRARELARAERRMVSLTPDPEPQPGCYCPDSLRRRSAAVRQRECPYCPRCGTPEDRGLRTVAG